MAAYKVSEVHPDALDLKELLEGVLERVVTIFESYNVPLPSRRYWTMGTPAIDCEQLVVSFIQMYLGSPGDQASTPQRCTMPRSAVMTISLAREVPTVGQNGRPPEGHKIQEYAEISAVDAWVLMQSINALDMWEEGGFGVGVIATVDASPSEGGFEVVNMQITMAVP
jgi:hypothetical protein